MFNCLDISLFGNLAEFKKTNLLKFSYLLLLLIPFKTIAQSKVELFVFFDTECPICQTYTNKLQKFYKDYGQKVSFKLVYPTKGTTPKIVQAFEKEYGFKIPYQIDEAHTIVKKYNASTTPEAVLVKNGEIIYRGAIDNQFVSLGKFRPRTSDFYLYDALEAVKNNQMVLVKKSTPVGCLINH